MGDTGGLLLKSYTAIPGYYDQKKKIEKKLGRTITNEEFEKDYFEVPQNGVASGTSIFDPVLSEILCTWFCPPSGSILDPFAGGSVRGIVAGYHGFQYTGVELRKEQVSENEKQAKAILKGKKKSNAKWICGDSLKIDKLVKGSFDFILSCPPYFDLEKYSDDPADLSNMTYPDFLEAYQSIIAKSVQKLKDNRFACFVISDIRDKNGYYRGFMPDTIQAFKDSGMHLYNDAILLNPVGSLAVRVGRQFSGYRKLGRSHQNILIFHKGDPKQIKSDFPESPGLMLEPEPEDINIEA